MKFLRYLLVVQLLITTVPTVVFAHPPTKENQLDKIDCHYTSGAGGEKHYHKNNDYQVEYPCTEIPSTFLNNPIYLALGFFAAGLAGALLLGILL